MTAIAEMVEQWRPVPDYEGLYEVSSLGRIRSLYFSPPRLSKAGTDSCGYPIIMLTKNGKRKPFTIHRIVCRAFHGPAQPLQEAAHLDGDRSNPAAENLKWCSKAENHAHKLRHGTLLCGSKHPCAILTEEDATFIRHSKLKANDLARRFGISHHTVSDIRQGKRWKSLGAVHESAGLQGIALTTPAPHQGDKTISSPTDRSK